MEGSSFLSLKFLPLGVSTFGTRSVEPQTKAGEPPPGGGTYWRS